MTLFVDTGVWYAALDRSDRSHTHAAEILSRGDELVLTDHVLCETWRLAAHRLSWGVADRLWQTAMEGGITVEPVTLGDLERAWQIRAEFSDQSFSLVDCTSFAVCERLRLRDVAAFDDDFAVFRFGTGRSQAFRVLR